ncbi:MAG TPA: hypothetical protein VFP22_10800, partial [Candidatus Limnocylindrales bacterium]|nr:hypothetical protein [Candidatus Limnocylindrales bacterium]
DSTRMSRTIDLVRLSPAGEPISRQKIGTLGVDIGPKSVRSISTDMDLAADGRRGLLVIGFLTDETVSYDAMPIDLGAGQIGPLVHIGTQVVPPAPPPSSDAPSIDPGQGPDLPQLYGPVVRMSPSGSHAFVWGVLQQPAVVGPTAELPIAWNVALDDRGTPTTSTPAAGLAKMPLYCGALGFVSDVRLVAICPHFPARGVDAPLEWAFVDVNGDGSHEREIALPALQSFTPDITFDRANQIAWIWDATRLTLARIDMGTTELTSTTYPPNVDLAPGIGAPFRGRSPVWDRPVSAVYGAIGQQMVGSADGTRMYLVGTGGGPTGGDGQPASLGIFVVDPRTLALVDRWDPDANYVSVQLAFDDAVVVASGAPGIDASGANAAWDASLTFHAAQGGQILLRLGQVGNGWAAVVVDR